MSEKDSINLLEILSKFQNTLRFLLKKWKLVGLFVFIGSGLGVIYSIKSKPVYSSSLSFVVEGESNIGGIANLASTFGFGKSGGGQGVFTSANILDLLKSESLVRKALLQPLKNNTKKSFADLFIEFSDLQESFKEHPELLKVHFQPDSKLNKLTSDQINVLVTICALIRQDINVEIKNPDNTIVFIDLKSENEYFSRHFPSELIKIVSEYYIETKTRKAKLNYEVIKQQTDSVRRELNNAISGVASANDNTFLLNPAFNIKRVPSAHKEVNVQANQAILTELVKNLELSRMNLLNETPFIEIIDAPISELTPRKFGKTKGIILGGFLGGFLIIIYLIFKNYLKNLLKSSGHKLQEQK